MIDDVYVYVVDLGVTSVTETVTENADGSYSIFLNSRLTQESRMKGYYHALNHIIRNDFEKSDVDKIETECHRISIGG